MTLTRHPLVALVHNASAWTSASHNVEHHFAVAAKMIDPQRPRGQRPVSSVQYRGPSRILPTAATWPLTAGHLDPAIRRL